MGFKIRVDSPESGVTWADTSLMPVHRLWLTAMGGGLNELALSLAYTTATGALSNVKLASVTFPLTAGGQDGLVRKLSTVAIATGDIAKDIARTTDVCRGLVNVDVKERDIETITAQAVELVKAYWQVLGSIEAGTNDEVAFNGFRIKIIS